MDVKAIAEIRKETQLPMYECKEAFDQEGSVEKAIKFLREKKREIPESISEGGTLVVLTNRPPYTIIDTRSGIDNRHLEVVV